MLEITRGSCFGADFIEFVVEHGADVDEVAASPSQDEHHGGKQANDATVSANVRAGANLDMNINADGSVNIDASVNIDVDTKAQIDGSSGINTSDSSKGVHTLALGPPGQTPVMHVMSGCLRQQWDPDSCTKIVEILIGHGAHLKPISVFGTTPLHMAAKQGNLHLCQLLMTHGADPNAVDDAGDTPVIEACKSGDVTLVKSLAKGANWAAQAGIAGMLLTPLHIAAAAGNRPLVEFLLHHNTAVNTQAYWKRAPLHLCVVGMGHEEGLLDEDRFLVLNELINYKASVNDADIDGETALSLALQRKAWRTARTLLSRGADPRAQHGTPSCLARAIDGNNTDIIRLILKTHPECAQEAAALIAGIRAGSQEVLKVVMSVGGTCYMREGAGFQQPGVLITHWSAPLWWSCYFGQQKFVRQLLDGDTAASAETADANGMTLLHWCAVWGAGMHTKAAAELIDHGASVNAKDNTGQTPLHWAAKYGHQELMSLFTSHNADVEIRDNSGQSIRDVANKAGHAGEQHSDDIHELQNHHSESGIPFCDKEFLVGLDALAKDVSKAPAAFREIVWLRPAEINFTGCSDSTSAGSHAWFSATVGAFGPDSVKENFVGDSETNAGVYCVKCIGPNLEESHVIVDDLLPCINGAPAFTATDCQQDLKVIIVEKAYAKLFGSYEALLGCWAPPSTSVAAEGHEVLITEFATARLSSVMCSPVGRRMKEAGELSLASISNHFAAQNLPALASQLCIGTVGSSINPVTSVGSSAAGCNAAYSISTNQDAVLKVSVFMIEGKKPLSGSLDVYSETGASWIFCGSRRCHEADHLHLEVPISAAASPYVVVPTLGPGSGYKLEIAATEEVSVKPMMARV